MQKKCNSILIGYNECNYMKYRIFACLLRIIIIIIITMMIIQLRLHLLISIYTSKVEIIGLLQKKCVQCTNRFKIYPLIPPFSVKKGRGIFPTEISPYPGCSDDVHG